MPDSSLKILVVNGEPFSDATATGITLCNLFKAIPREDIAQIYTANLPPRDDLCGLYLKLSASNLVSSGNVAAGAIAKPPALLHSRKAKAKAAVRKIVAPLLECMSYKLSPQVKEKLRDFGPNVVYTLGGSMRQLKLALDIAEGLNRPLVIHFMDDWPATLYQSPILAPMRSRLNRLTMAAVRKAKARLVISGAMASEYRSRYRAEFVPFMNCVSKRRVIQARCAAAGAVKNICYFGGLHLGRGDVILQVAKAMEQVGIDKEIGIDLYCRPADVFAHRAAFQSHNCLRFREAVPPDHVGEVMQGAGALLHVESFTPAHRKYTRLSISTKIPEYLASGRPILAIGPTEVASIRYLEENAAGIVVTSTENTPILDALKKLRDPNMLSTITRNAFELVMKNHVSAVECDRFRRVLAQAAFN